MEQLMGEDTITITDGSSDNDTIIINLNNTYGTTASYSTDGFIVGSTPDTYTIDNTIWNNGGGSTINSISITEPQWWVATEGTHLEIAEVEKMCVEYPALAKVYENFKTMYDLVKQDWQGKKNVEENS